MQFIAMLCRNVNYRSNENVDVERVRSVNDT